jgi:DNA-binding transcriptional ArsR family regulator
LSIIREMSDEMSPDYALTATVAVETPAQYKAVAEPLRREVLDLVMERAATVTELAAALGRPKGTMAYHVRVLEEAGLLRVVRTRRVRAIEERFYGRTGRTIVFGQPPSGDKLDLLAEAWGELPADRELIRSTLRHARVPAEAAEEFFAAVVALAEEFTRLARGGDTVYGFLGAVFPTSKPTLGGAGG